MSQFATSTGFFADTVARREECDDTPKLVFRRAPTLWSADGFARAQLQGLLQKLFLAGHENCVRHVLFSSIDRETHVESIARLLGEALANENVGSVAVMARVSHHIGGPQAMSRAERASDHTPLRQAGLRLRENLWLVPDAIEDGTSASPKLDARVCNLRREFDYSITVGPTADTHQMVAMAAIADGIVLALSAGHTRRATARSVMGFLQSANVQVLGTVLIDRAFPIPASIYCRL